MHQELNSAGFKACDQRESITSDTDNSAKVRGPFCLNDNRPAHAMNAHLSTAEAVNLSRPQLTFVPD